MVIVIHMTQKKITRRKFLRYLGATTVILAGGTVWRAVDQGVFDAGEGPAYEAWRTWRTDKTEGPLALVRAGILAANPHNTQPWIFRTSSEQIELYADTQRHLGAMDPFLREMHLGLGCALENMLLTAEAIGYRVNLSLVEGTLTTNMAETGIQKVATLALSPTSPQPSPLYEAIPDRHTNRYLYTGAILPDLLFDQLQALNDDDDLRIFLFHTGTQEFAKFKEGTETSTQFIVNDVQMAHDSFAWFPQSWNDVQRDKAGPYIDTAGVQPIMRAIVKMVPGLPSQSAVDNAMVNDASRHLETASGVGIIAVRSLYDVAQTLRAGQLWQRSHLWGTTQDIAMQPHNEMPEVVDREQQLGLPPQMAEHLVGITDDETWFPTFTFRIGKSTVSPLPSARRFITDVVQG